jgi:hypothetical protein
LLENIIEKKVLNIEPIEFKNGEMKKDKLYNELSYKEIIDQEKNLYEMWTYEELDLLKIKNNLFIKLKIYCSIITYNELEIFNEMINKLKLIYSENKDIEFLDFIKKTAENFSKSIKSYNHSIYNKSSTLSYGREFVKEHSTLSCIPPTIIYNNPFEATFNIMPTLIKYNNKELIISLLKLFD